MAAFNLQQVFLVKIWNSHFKMCPVCLLFPSSYFNEIRCEILLTALWSEMVQTRSGALAVEQGLLCPAKLYHQCFNQYTVTVTPSLCLFARQFPSYSVHFHTTSDFLIPITMRLVNQAAVSAKHLSWEYVLFCCRLLFHVSNDKSKPRVTP